MNTVSNAKWAISPYVRSTFGEDGAILLDIKKGACCSLNAVVARIWAAIESSQAGMIFQEILDGLQSHFNVPRREIEAEIAEYLRQLEEMDLIQSTKGGY